MQCKTCQQETFNPTFCSSACAAKCNNTSSPKRKRSKQCKKCKSLILSNRTYCDDCWLGKEKPVVILQQEPQEEQKCLKCNIILNSNNATIVRKRFCTYCKYCSNKTNKKAKVNFKNACIQYKGGKCVVCGYNKNSAVLQFHHRDPSKKDFTISAKRKLVMDEELKLELDKCDLVCSNCHCELHNKDKNIEPLISYEPQIYSLR